MVTVALVVTARPSYARVKTLILALQQRCRVRLVLGGSALLERYGAVVDLIEAECGPAAWKCWSVVEGETLETAARSTGLLLTDFAAAFRSLQPDAVIVHGDRYEVLGAAAAARILELPLIHLQGGEQTGSVDDRIRDAVTQLADCHLVSTYAARQRVADARNFERGQFFHAVNIHWTGCPSIDVARGVAEAPLVDPDEIGGAGASCDLSSPFLVVLQHPTTDRYGTAFDDMALTLASCAHLGLPTIVFWPGNEAGMAAASKAIRLRQDMVHTVRNLPPERFLSLLTQSACLVGNSSVGIRECSYLGVPVVNVGDRQRHRERAENVVDVQPDPWAIADAIQSQMAHGPYPSSSLYGDGRGGERMAEAVMVFLGG